MQSSARLPEQASGCMIARRAGRECVSELWLHLVVENYVVVNIVWYVLCMGYITMMMISRP